MRTTLILASALALAGCAELTDKAMARTAETVVRPVIDDVLPGDQADVATRCIVENATSADLRALVHDVAVVAGTSTVANVMAIAGRPETLACMVQGGVVTSLLGGI